MDKATLVNAVKSLVKIELENDSWGVAAMAAVKEISGISKIVSDASAKDKARLVSTNERRDKGLKPVSQDFGDPLDGRILKSNRAKVLRLPGIIFFRKKHKIGSVEALDGGSMRVKGIKERI